MKTKKLGIIGGMGSRAGVCLLQKIIDYSPAESDQEFPEIIFHNNAQTPDRTKAIINGGPSPVDDMLRSIKLFNENDVEIIAIGCITAYYYYREISACTDARIINPLHLVVEYIKKEYTAANRVGLLATTGTINSGLFHREFTGSGIELVTLAPEDQETVFMRSVYMKNGFKSARISRQARELMTKAVEKLSRQQVDLIIGGCTEVSIATGDTVIDFPYIDTLDLLARKTVDYCYNPELIKT